MNNSMRKRFIKDFSLPIPITKSPYFEYFIDLYEDLLKSRTKYGMACGILDNFSDERAFLNWYDEFKNTAINAIKETQAYQDFLKMDIGLFPVDDRDFSKKSIYNESNKDKTFISIDLIKANFNIMKWINPEIVGNKETYDAFIMQFADEIYKEYVCKSKYIRQVVFGNLNPKRQQQIQRHVISKMIMHLTQYITKDRVKSVTSDEIIIDITDSEITKNQIIEIIAKIDDKGLPPFRVEQFMLKQLGSTDIFVKEFADGKIEFKNAGNIFFAQCFKYYYNLQINEYDLYFSHEKQICRFITTLFS